MEITYRIVLTIAGHPDQRQDASSTTIISPKWTYAIFGDNEKIFGYQGLTIDITFAKDTLLTLLEINFTSKISGSLGIDAEDLEGTLAEFLAPDTFRSRELWESRCKDTSLFFTPPGKLEAEYSIEDVNYAIYRSNVLDSGSESLMSRAQMFSMLFIEGASMIDTLDDRFDMWTVYARNDGIHEFIGYCTCYRFFFYDRIEHDLKHLRYRISQFLILPCHQSRGHGGNLYDAIFRYCISQDQILELTVEDPSEAFDDLRDRRDYLLLQSKSVFAEQDWTIFCSLAWIKSTRRRHKLAPRQFIRLLEMVIVSKMNERDATAQKRFRLMVKSRLYKKNVDVLAALTYTERLEKLQETFDTQLQDYKRLLSGLRLCTESTKHKVEDNTLHTNGTKRQKTS